MSKTCSPNALTPSSARPRCQEPPKIALEQARAAAGDKDVALAGGASVVQQYLKAGWLDELQIHLVPVLLGGGVRLFDRLDAVVIELRPTRVIESATVTHLRFQVVKNAVAPWQRDSELYRSPTGAR